MSRRHADIWSHPSHYLVDPYTWPWSPNGQDHIWPSKFKYQGHGQGQTHWSYLRPRVQINMFAFRIMAIRPVLVEIYKNSYFTLKIQAQGHSQGQIWWSHLRPRVQSMCLLFILWQSDHFWQRYSQFDIWPWRFRVKVMSKVKPNGHIWGLEINRYVCFSFRGNRTIFDWDITNSTFDLENSRSRSWPKSKPMVTFEA